MGTQLPRLALLLAVLQYAALQYAAVQAGGSACAGATNPKSDCDAGLDPTIGCTKLTTPNFPSEGCATGFKNFIRLGNTGPWKALSVAVGCSAAPPGWKVKVFGDSAEKILTAADNMVCAAFKPDSGPCEWCRKRGPAECKDTDGCVVGGEVLVAADPAAAGCLIMKCKVAGEWLKTDPESTTAIDKLTCDANKKWGGIALNKASCIKNIECHKKTKLKSECTAYMPSTPTCETIPLNNDADKECNANKKLYYKNGASWVKQDGKKVTCDSATGIWKIDTTALKAGDEVLCAATEPSTSSAPVLCTVASPAIDTVCTKADVSTASDVNCAETTLTDDAALPCTTPADLYIREAAGWVKGAVQCDKGTGKWKLNGGDAAITRAICAEDDPTVPCTACPAFTETATLCDAAAGCTAGALQAQSADPATGCLELTCATGQFFLYNTDKIAAVDAKMTCSASKTWELVAETAVTDAVCVEKFVCQKKMPLKTLCDGIEATGCEVIADFMPDDLACADPATHKLYVKSTGGSVWEEAPVLFCDAHTGEWKRGATKDAALPMTAQDTVVCATKLPVECPDLDVACEATHLVDVAAGIACVPVVDPKAPELKCPAADDATAPTIRPADWTPKTKHYFKRMSDPDPNHYRQAKSVKCNTVTGKWDAEYKYGLNTLTVELGKDDRVFCALSNPEPKVCEYRSNGHTPTGYALEKMKEPNTDTALGVPVGMLAGCKSPLHEFISSDSKKEQLTNNVVPVCSQSGHWERPRSLPVQPAAGDPIQASYEDFKDKIACGIKKCLSCAEVKPIEGFTVLNSIANEIRRSGACATMGCGSSESKYAVKDEDGDNMYFYSTEAVTCVQGDEWTIGKKLKPVKQMTCTQRMYCLVDRFKQAKTTEACPTTDPKFLAAGCENVKVHKYSDPVPTGQEAYDELSCENGKKMFVQGIEGYWIELKDASMRCGTSTGKWDGKKAEDDSKYEIESVDDNTFYCANYNPNLKPTTTTTTTTPAPPEEICELCKKHLPTKTDCTTCNSTEVDLNPAKDGKDECIMTPKTIKVDGKDVEYSLIVGDNNEKVDKIICTRYDDNKAKWYRVQINKEGKEEAGPEVMKFTSRKAPKDTKLKTMAYVVIGIGALLIGGMAISCVVIYLRMRKQLSEREKKKERGVTKKYTTANVMKTSGKSSNASELGKSKEPTKSKLDEQEDAPTLKL